ncbi:hypothetical protein [Umezawaea sp. Da 62-37]|uniref:hypothetical protein n=1 Tax=Umezawaea sp. Da 62-37 TaxID=3075927 RepID=UPI0028F721F7|nr:hypothetical protein [Umezawaea sp. Da 62-37]WNV84910.1 hypothetical protein RM788_43245 [Umezawaea sp. Da 62-37]
MTTRLFALVADLAGLAGWMSHDTTRFAAAQRYWAFGVMASRRAGQPGRGAELISRMAHQRVFFGHPADALELLDVADRVARQADPDHRLQAMLTAQRGRMLAATGDARSAQYFLACAGDLLATAEQHRQPAADWISYFTAAELVGTTAVSRRDLRELHDKDIGPASAAFADAVLLRDPGYDRCQAMDRVGHVAALLNERQPEQACSVAHQALHAAAGLDSTLIRSRILTLTDAAGPFQRHPDVLALRERANGMAVAPTVPAA